MTDLKRFKPDLKIEASTFKLEETKMDTNKDVKIDWTKEVYSTDIGMSLFIEALMNKGVK